MRTSSVTIERVAHWLEYFTLAELIFVLQEDAHMYPFDKFRIEKIALALRHTFSSNQTDNEVRMLIEDLSTAYSQTRPLIKPTSISSITIRQYQHLLVPFRSSCPICSQSLNQNNCKQKRIRLYCHNGAVMIGTLFTLHCDHPNTSCRSLPVEIFPNFVRMNNQNIYNEQSLYYGRYIYIGGDVAVERSVIDKYMAQIVHHDVSMMGYAASLNQQAVNNGYTQLLLIDRRILSNTINTFLIIQFHICVGHLNVTVPCLIKDFNKWAWDQFPRLLTCFIYLWTNHRSIIGSCGEHCSKCLVVDGHQKTRRRICAFKNVTVNTDEMKNLIIGCCRTPVVSSHYCELHNKELSTKMLQNAKCISRRKLCMRTKFRKSFIKSLRDDNHLNATGCRTLKARSDRYMEQCTRSFGLIALVSNCRIITSFSELYRSETLKEIINLFAITFRAAGRLAPTLVYDDGCHLVKYVKNHIGRDLARTEAMEILAATPVSVDRTHFRNHVGKFCRQTMNPDKNPLLNNVNTQAAEQTFSWLKQYANIMSNLGYQRAPLYMLTLFHMKNMSMVNRSPYSVFDVASICPKVDAVSLCHIEQCIAQSTSTGIAEMSIDSEQAPLCQLYNGQIDLPKSTTDWDAKVLEIINKKKSY